MPSNTRIKLAIADDQVLFMRGLKLILEEYKNIEIVIEAFNGLELLAFMQQTVPDVILLDLRMPILNGIETTEKIKAQYPNVKIILLTMHDDERMMNHMMKSGANAYLLKNEEPKTVYEAIVTVHEEDYYFSNYVSKALLKGVTTSQKVLTAQLDQNLHLGLTRRELEVLNLICQELTTQEIAGKLFISSRTVEGHRKNLLEKTGARNTAGLVFFALKHHLVSFE